MQEWSLFERKVRNWYPWKEQRSGKTQRPRWSWWDQRRGPRGPLWLSWVCFSFGFNPRLSTSLPIRVRLPSGVPLFPWPCMPSSRASPRTRKCLFAIAHSPWVRVYQEDSGQASLSLLIPGKWEEMQSKTAFSLVFLLCSGIGVTLSAFTDCLRQRSDAGLRWRPDHEDGRSSFFFFLTVVTFF